MKKGYFVLLFLLIAIFLENAAEAKSLKKGEVYSLLNGEMTIEVISNSELEINIRGIDFSSPQGRDRRDIILAEYDFKGDKLRIIFTREGTKVVKYYLMTNEGLKDEERGMVFYSKAGLAAFKKVPTITDNVTGLMWQKEDDNTERTWDDAITYCNALTLGGYNDWRLPNIEDLESIGDKNYFPNAKAGYWSSTTPTDDSALAWFVVFGDGNARPFNKSAGGYVRCVRESSTPSPSPDTQLKDEELQKLKTFITDRWKQVVQIPPPKRDWRELVTLKITGKYDDYSSLYLFGLNMRGRASDAFASADKFLKKSDLKNAQKYADLGARYYIESNNLFSASEQVFSGSVSMSAQVLEAAYRGPAEASKYGWFLMCGPKCYEVADYVFLMTDFAMDYGLEGMDEAKKNLIVNAFVKTLLKTSGVSKWIENRTTHLIGDSGLYGLMDKTINSPEFQKAFMKVVAESGAYTTQKMANEGGKKIIRNSLVFIKGSSNLKPAN